MDVDMGSLDSMEVVCSCTILSAHIWRNYVSSSAGGLCWWSMLVVYGICFQFSRSVLNIGESLSRLFWTPLKLVPPRTKFSGPTLKNLFLL